MKDKRSVVVRKREASTAASVARVDRRILRTQRALGAALTELMVTREFSAITVQDVLDRAGVGRSTFYAHYRNKDDLLLSDAERFLHLLEDHFEKTRGCDRRVAPIAELFHHVREYRDFQRALDRSGRKQAVYELVVGHLARTIERRLALLLGDSPETPLPLPVASRSFACAVVDLLGWWLDHDERFTPAEMDRRFHDILWGGIGKGS